MPTIRVRRHQVDENTNVGYHGKHVFPELGSESIAPGRRVHVARIGGIALLLAGAALVAVVVLGHSTPHTLGNPVASSKQVPATKATKTGSGTVGTTHTVGRAGSLASRTGNAGVSTRAARGAGPSSGGSAGGAALSPSMNPASAASPAVNLPVPAHFGPLLRQAWARANPGGVGIKATDILSTAVGSVFYAEQPAVHTYWAISQFVPSALAQSRGSTSAGVALLAEFRGTAEFQKVPGHRWAYVGSFSTGSCPGALPVPVLTTWGLCAVGS
jgi:hypothetical protein